MEKQPAGSSSSYFRETLAQQPSEKLNRNPSQQFLEDVSLQIQNYMNDSDDDYVEEPSDVKNASKETYVLGDSLGVLDKLEDLATPEMQIITEEEEYITEQHEIIETQEVMVRQEEIAEVMVETRIRVEGDAAALASNEAKGQSN